MSVNEEDNIGLPGVFAVTSPNSPQGKYRGKQRLEGTQRSEEPVSNSTEKSCGGVPMLIFP